MVAEAQDSQAQDSEAQACGDRALAALLADLADPVRIAVLDRLADGPATASQLASELALAPPRLAHHLARLRGARLVTVSRSGRHVSYGLADPRVTAMLGDLRGLASPNRRPARIPAPDAPLAQARSCYDHLAGRLGVAVFDYLVAAGAVTAPADPPPASSEPPGRAGARADLALGPGAAEGFAALGVDPFWGSTAAARPPRRKLAVTCLDWTQRRPHLGGALGAAVLDHALTEGWVQRADGRALTVTPAGRRQLAGLGITAPGGAG
jgi:DNA-binding transcriptional ArsR family regulator